ncbi:hypothetical protein THAOC_25565 [Thalassiosira oceanica]|uniref:Uncharacterized protein n=1 Tax=Thalassiosira oceanica TaxID=159749 RepID=K0S7J0_THAOC|nr:hypothetical protein THAOC_25565 [Thalassiosira oceanica]|eukprot:EJK54777.1 hypothetical protein THAOC_25565 [Thalassiosira oceanica]
MPCCENIENRLACRATWLAALAASEQGANGWPSANGRLTSASNKISSRGLFPLIEGGMKKKERTGPPLTNHLKESESSEEYLQGATLLDRGPACPLAVVLWALGNADVTPTGVQL